MKTFHCICSSSPALFFESQSCTACRRVVGITDAFTEIQAFDWDDENSVYTQRSNPGKFYQKCANFAQHQACNGMVEVDRQSTDSQALCFACRFNRIIPDLSISEHLPLWRKMEAAKRRALYTLNSLGLPLVTKNENPNLGLAFEFLVDSDARDHFASPLPNQEPAMTGHAQGVITINLAEADDVSRSAAQMSMGERYRTLLGHFRHELGHYFFDVLVAGHESHNECKRYFGDESEDYQAALSKHYEHGAPVNWNENYISAYATMHPSEDWAETWSHYLHIVDTLETAKSHGLSLLPHKRGDVEAIAQLNLPQNEKLSPTNQFEELLKTWMHFSVVMNAINRSMGVQDAYPFVLTEPVRQKLVFIDGIVNSCKAENCQG